MAEKFLNMRQAEERLGVSSRTIFNFIQRGELRGFKIGKSWRFEEGEIEAYIERQRQKQGRPEKSVA